METTNSVKKGYLQNPIGKRKIDQNRWSLALYFWHLLTQSHISPWINIRLNTPKQIRSSVIGTAVKMSMQAKPPLGTPRFMEGRHCHQGRQLSEELQRYAVSIRLHLRPFSITCMIHMIANIYHFQKKPKPNVQNAVFFRLRTSLGFPTEPPRWSSRWCCWWSPLLPEYGYRSKRKPLFGEKAGHFGLHCSELTKPSRFVRSAPQSLQNSHYLWCSDGSWANVI